MNNDRAEQFIREVTAIMKSSKNIDDMEEKLKEFVKLQRIERKLDGINSNRGR
jgi:hypothetical protein